MTKCDLTKINVNKTMKEVKQQLDLDYDVLLPHKFNNDYVYYEIHYKKTTMMEFFYKENYLFNLI